MTTAFSHAVRGDLLVAGMTQPAGLLLCLMLAMTAIGGAYAAFTGAAMHRVAGVVARPAMIWSVLAVLIGAWAYKLVGAIT